MQVIGDCFVVLPPYCANDTIIVGRNSEDSTAVGVSQEIHFLDVNESIEGKMDGGATPNNLGDKQLRIILQKPKPGIWGSEYGANELNVSIGITWSSGENNNETLLATDVVRLALATSTTATDAIDKCDVLITEHGSDDNKFNLLICDPKEAWILSCGGKLWAAQLLKSGFQRLPSDGLAVTTIIDKSSKALEEELKNLGFWNGESPLNFAACFNATPNKADWVGPEPSGDGSYTLISMFETLRAAAKTNSSRAANVSILTSKCITCHWFTGTPNASESVFKPFVFAPNPKISPLTKLTNDSELTLLHKLYLQRKPTAFMDLKQLEASCVEEVAAYLAEHPTVDEELDELLKDCVEAEVKFYR